VAVGPPTPGSKRLAPRLKGAYPRATVGEIEEEAPEAFMPFLNRKRLAEEWPQLLEHARRVYECQRSGARHGYQS